MGGRRPTSTTFEKQLKLFEGNYFELMKHITAGEVWHCHPDQLMGDKFAPRMLLSMTAARMAYDTWKVKHRAL